MLAGVPLPTRRACICPIGAGRTRGSASSANSLACSASSIRSAGGGITQTVDIEKTDLQRGQERARLRLRRRACKEVLHRGLGLVRGYRTLVANHGLHRRLDGRHAAERAPPGSLAPPGRRGTSSPHVLFALTPLTPTRPPRPRGQFPVMKLVKNKTTNLKP